MISPSWQSCINTLKKQSDRLLPDVGNNSMVSAATQQEEIELLKRTLHYEKMFFIINARTLTIEQANGVVRWLGFGEEQFTIEKYYSIIHPSYLAAQMAGTYELFEVSMSGKIPIQFMGYYFTDIISLQHAGGEYRLFKRLIIPFQHDDKSRLLSYLNEFTLIGHCESKPYCTRITDRLGNAIAWEDDFFKTIKSSFEKQAIFSTQELRILYKFASNPSVSSAEVAVMFKVKENTIITYKRRILQKAQFFFQRRFNTAREVASYLQEYRLI